jgi:YbgC/YbaW family acyl-CoA thioester hydrolase
LFSVKRKINFYDCDPAGILFFGRIFELCHSAYEEMIASFNLKENYWSNEDYIVPIITSEASYKKALKYGEIVTINIKVAQLKSSSFELNYECKNEQGIVTNEVRTVHVCVSKGDWNKRELPEIVFKSLETLFSKN